LETKIHSLANNTLATGWLELESAAAGFSKNYKIPGTKMKYKCSEGFSQPDGTNPNQKLSCSGSLKVDMTQIRLCERKHTLLDNFFFNLAIFLADRCEVGGPDMANATGASNDWSGAIIYETPVKYTCPPGRAFDGLFNRETWGNCTWGGLDVYWKYNSSNPLPNCIGRTHAKKKYNCVSSSLLC
jgi:hypothetical protein